MAEGLLRNYFGNKYEAYSAGTQPSNVHPLAIKTMKELNIDISNHSSKHFEELKEVDFDIVITVCDTVRESCPLYFGNAQKLHWGFEDPATASGTEEEVLTKFHQIRDQIKNKILDYFQNS